MSKNIKNTVQPSQIVEGAGWVYQGGQTLTPNNSSTQCTLPSGTNAFILSAEGQDAYFEMNAAAADANSPGYVPSGMTGGDGPLAVLTSLYVFMATGTGKCHLRYYKAFSS